MDSDTKKYVFGPVPSRRLGRSLGVDLVPFKTCTFNCVYCQLGCTPATTIERKEWVPVEPVLEQILEKISGDSKPDYITFSGSGEPTLHSGIGEIIKQIKEMTDIPVAVLTNGSLLWKPEVRQSLLEADLVVPSLDAGDEQLYQYVNRPDPAISFEKLVEGLVQFRKEYTGKLWLEVFLLGGVTGIESEVRKLADIVRQIKPDRVHLNTVARPPAENFAFAVAKEKLKRFADIFEGDVEIAGEETPIHEYSDLSAHQDDILTMLERRPCTIEDISRGLGMHQTEVIKYVDRLVEENRVSERRQNGIIYYAVVTDRPG